VVLQPRLQSRRPWARQCRFGVVHRHFGFVSGMGHVRS
jgi:hypothetical protein